MCRRRSRSRPAARSWRIAARFNGSDDANVSADLSSLRADPRPDRRLDRGRGDRGTAAERGRLPDRSQPAAPDELRRPAARSSREGPAARWRCGSCPSSPAGHRRSSRRTGSLGLRGAPLGATVVRRGAARSTRWPGPRPSSAACRLGAVGQTELRIELEQRREHEAPRRDLRVGKGEAVGAQLDIAEEQQVDVDRAGAVAGSVEARPCSASIALQTSSSCVGSSAVRIRMAALRKSGWSRNSPTGSVS